LGWRHFLPKKKKKETNKQTNKMKEYTFQGSAGAASSSLGNWDRSNSSASASINVLSGVINA
jgi:hypothetical protein